MATRLALLTQASTSLVKTQPSSNTCPSTTRATTLLVSSSRDRSTSTKTRALSARTIAASTTQTQMHSSSVSTDSLIGPMPSTETSSPTCHLALLPRLAPPAIVMDVAFKIRPLLLITLLMASWLQLRTRVPVVLAGLSLATPLPRVPSPRRLTHHLSIFQNSTWLIAQSTLQISVARTTVHTVAKAPG